MASQPEHHEETIPVMLRKHLCYETVILGHGHHHHDGHSRFSILDSPARSSSISNYPRYFHLSDKRKLLCTKPESTVIISNNMYCSIRLLLMLSWAKRITRDKKYEYKYFDLKSPRNLPGTWHSIMCRDGLLYFPLIHWHVRLFLAKLTNQNLGSDKRMHGLYKDSY